MGIVENCILLVSLGIDQKTHALTLLRSVIYVIENSKIQINTKYSTLVCTDKGRSEAKAIKLVRTIGFLIILHITDNVP